MLLRLKNVVLCFMLASALLRKEHDEHISVLHDAFVKYFPGGPNAFNEAIRERSDWSPLQSLEYGKYTTHDIDIYPPKEGTVYRDAQWPSGHQRLDSFGPVIPCPTQLLQTFAIGNQWRPDSEKRVCGFMNHTSCTVISIGSKNEWEFELDVVKKYPHCRIHTFDCTVAAQVPEKIISQTTFHKICLGIADNITAEGLEFMSLVIDGPQGWTDAPAYHYEDGH